MTELDADTISKVLYQGLQDHSNHSVRSLQSREFRAGVSDLGYCSERVRRMLDQQVPYDTDVLAAFIGTAIGDHMEKVAQEVWPDAITQSEVSLTLEGEQGRTYVLSGHPDCIVPSEGLLIDFKSAYGLSVVERTGPSDQQQYQRHGYAKAAWEAGMFGDLPLEDVRVANVWVDRAAVDKRLQTHVEPFDHRWIDQAGAWLDNVVYAYLQGEEAAKEPPRDVCAVTCGFFDVCRAYDTDVEGLIRDKVALTAIEQYREGLDMEREGKRLKDQAKQHLVGIQGSTGEVMVRWLHVNETVVPESTRRAYDKLDVRKLPKGKVQGK